MHIQPIVIGTAGHIDHGKSSLVRALTGIDPDRLPEEQQRGLTIDLGFAPLVLPSGRTVGIVDVPGHERFLRNMVAGATGIDFVLLVVAADDGVMPQTREHLQILQILGLERGIVVLNKIDAVEPGMLDLAELELRELLAGSFLEHAPLLRVSALHGTGLPELVAALDAAALATPPRSDQGLFRMPVQRVFSARGHGTIATGIPVSGRVALGETLEVLPGGLRAKVRGLQAYKQTVESARAGHSTAINLADVKPAELCRGSVLAAPGFFQPFSMVGVRLSALATLSRPLRNRTRIRFHTGTADPAGELVLLDAPELAPGQSALAQLRLDEPVVCAAGDRYVLRLLTPELTLGGGVVLEESRHRLKRFKEFVISELAHQEQSLGSPARLLEAVLLRRGVALATPEELAAAVKRPAAELAPLLRELEQRGEARTVGRSGRWMHAQALGRALERLQAALEEFFARNELRAAAETLALRSALGFEPELFQALLEEAAARGKLALEAGGRVRPPSRVLKLDERARSLYEAVRARLSEAALQPPSAAELAQQLGAKEPELKRVLGLLVDEGHARYTSDGLWFASAAIERAKAAVIANCEQHGHLEIPALRDALGTTRKWLIPLLEHLDAQGVTIRQGSNRVLRRR